MNGLGRGKEVIVCCQSNVAKPQRVAASLRLKPRFGVKLAVIVVPPAPEGPDNALLMSDEHEIATVIAFSSEKYPVPPFGAIGTMKLTRPDDRLRPKIGNVSWEISVK